MITLNRHNVLRLAAAGAMALGASPVLTQVNQPLPSPASTGTRSAKTMLPTNCPSSELLPSALAMKTRFPQRIPYPDGSEDQMGVYGKATNGQRIAGHLKPEVRAGMHAQSGALLRDGVLSAALRELIIVRVGYRTASHYEVDQHSSLGERLGVPREKLLALACIHPSGLSQQEQAAIAFVDALLTEYEPSDAVLREVRSRFTDGEVLEMVFVTGNWWTLSRMLATAGIPSDSRKIGEEGVVRKSTP